MSITYRKDKKSGITYAYECTSVWVPELRQARNHRKYLGRVDEDGNIIPSTGRRGRPARDKVSSTKPEAAADPAAMLKERDQEIATLKAENEHLRSLLAGISWLLKDAALTEEEIDQAEQSLQKRSRKSS
ncbi:hypothetical protein [Allobaculum mucilyticum]|uniref:hypothetical protein n=1 Tax=Allobaculum mucilyticum TaxID=2834459 RepID=UPI001E52EEE0|nr:hypothetical protein [Allobaculum mucilyticum]UNT96968.1 hypothetical protein KWG62_04245 [Allobaculum mucilyticum]